MRKRQTTISFYLEEKACYDALFSEGLTAETFTQFVKDAFFKKVNMVRGGKEDEERI